MAKIICTGDWHFGRDNDSRKHNEYLMDFVEFSRKYAVDNDIEHYYQLGDFFDNRSKVSVETLNYAIDSVALLSKDVELSVLTGNHDMFFRNRVDVSSTKCLGQYADLITKPTIRQVNGSTLLLTPWVCSPEDWDSLVDQSNDVDYIFGHFEFKNFMMNEHYIMEHGLSHRELRKCKRVLTGHYHMRQEKDNVVYVGSPFPFDYNDANDLDRGFAVLDTATNEIEWVNWDKVKIFSLPYADFLEFKEEGLIDEHTSVRIELPDDADDTLIDEATTAVSELPSTSSKINYKGNKAKTIMETDVVVEEVDNIDQSVVNSIRSISDVPADVDVELLAELYLKSAGEHNED